MTRVRVTIKLASGLEIDIARDSLIDYGDDTPDARDLLDECVRRSLQALANAETPGGKP